MNEKSVNKLCPEQWKNKDMNSKACLKQDKRFRNNPALNCVKKDLNIYKSRQIIKTEEKNIDSKIGTEVIIIKVKYPIMYVLSIYLLNGI